MTSVRTYLALATVAGSLLLGACGNQSTRDTPTSTPSSMLGTDSAATKVGGMPVGTDSSTTTTGTGQ